MEEILGRYLLPGESVHHRNGLPGPKKSCSTTEVTSWHLQQCSSHNLSTLGGGGNRTRVPQYLTRASPGAACSAFLSPGGHTGKPPTGSVAVKCPDQPPDRDKRWILLADAKHRVGGTPGLTVSKLSSAA